MAAALLEIVDRGDGEIVLRRAGEDEEPLVTISFSEEAMIYMMDYGLEVAKVMIQAGIQAVATISQRTESDADTPLDIPRTLH